MTAPPAEKPQQLLETVQDSAAKKLLKFAVQRLLKWGLPTTGLGATAYFVVEGDWTASIISFFLTLIISLFTILWTFTQNVYKRILEKNEERLNKKVDETWQVLPRQRGARPQMDYFG